MLDALEPVLERLTSEKEPDDPLLREPRSGVLTTATVCDATQWDDLVAKLGFDNLTRHGLRQPKQPEWLTPASPSMCSKRSTGTSRSRPPRATCAQLAEAARPTSSSPQRPPGGPQPAATEATYDDHRAAAPTLSEGAGASACPYSGPPHVHYQCTPAGHRPDSDQYTLSAEGSSRSTEWTSQRPPQKRRSPGESCLSPGRSVGLTGFEPATP
jgi:hypothetical protein